MRIAFLGLALALSLAPASAFADQPNASPLMIVTFSIKDYNAWRPVFDAATAERAQDGVSKGQVYRCADRPNDLLVVFEVADEKRARAWMASMQVRADWEKGGVTGTPSYRFAK
jgi:hypothetical protein